MDIKLTQGYIKWEKSLNREARVVVSAKLAKAVTRNFENAKSLGGGLYELKIDFAQGYRVYFGKKENKVVILIAGGTKKGQQKEINVLKKIWKEIG